MTIDREGVRALVRELLHRKGDRSPARDDETLITSGRLDSVDVLEIVTHLESRHGFDFSARPFDPSDFDSIDKIVALESA